MPGKTITSWSFVPTDVSDYLEHELALPSVNLAQQADFDTVTSMLPTQIRAEVEGEPVMVNLAGWECAACKRDDVENCPPQGTYTFIAALPEAFILDSGTAPLAIQVTLGGANTFANHSVIAGSFTLISDSELVSGTDYEYSNNTLTIKSNKAVTMSGTTTQDKLVVASGVSAAITLNGANIDVSNTPDTCTFDVTGANVTLTLADGSDNSLKSGENCAGLQAPNGSTLTIQGFGKLTAMGGKYSAGIGGGSDADGGKITINDNAHVEAIGGGSGVGIGGGSAADGGKITISGSAHIKATGGGAGIGGGSDADGGKITINGNSIVFAAGSDGGSNIGGGGNDGGSGAILKNGGVIFEGKTGEVWGDVTLSRDLTVPAGYTLTVPSDPQSITLTVGSGSTLTNSGTITMNGTLTIAPGGVFRNLGTLNGSGTKPVEESYTVHLNKSTLHLKTGDSETLIATVTPANATNKAVTWSSSDPAVATVDTTGRVTAIKVGNTIITATAVDGHSAKCNITVEQSSNGGGDNSGGGSSSDDSGNDSGHTPVSPDVTTPPATPDQPYPPTNSSTTVSGKPDKDGHVSVTVPDRNITETIRVAQKQADTNGISVTVNIQIVQSANSMRVTLSKAALDALIAAEVKELHITSSLISMSFHLESLKEIQQSVIRNLTITATKPVTLSKAAQAVIGSRPAFDLSMQSGGSAITDFGKGAASVWIPYTLTENEVSENVQAVYVDGDRIEWLTSSGYDQSSKAVQFSTTHFSIYGVGYKPESPVFTDVANHWAKEYIAFVADRGLFSGMGGGKFSPNSGMTRAMFVTALGQLAGIDPAAYPSSGRFDDVAAAAYYAPYVEWAASRGIVKGITPSTFHPNQNITRQEMAVIMQGYATSMDYTLPQTCEAVTFTDSSAIRSWASDAVQAMQQAEILTGKEGNAFDPTGVATRAEAATVLCRFVELVIDSATT